MQEGEDFSRNSPKPVDRPINAFYILQNAKDVSFWLRDFAWHWARVGDWARMDGCQLDDREYCDVMLGIRTSRAGDYLVRMGRLAWDVFLSVECGVMTERDKREEAFIFCVVGPSSGSATPGCIDPLRDEPSGPFIVGSHI